MEMAGAGVPKEVKKMSLDLLVLVAHVINLRVVPGKRLLRCIGHGIEATTNNSEFECVSSPASI